MWYVASTPSLITIPSMTATRGSRTVTAELWWAHQSWIPLHSGGVLVEAPAELAGERNPHRVLTGTAAGKCS